MLIEQNNHPSVISPMNAITAPSNMLMVTSHIGRALLANADQFRNEAQVCWEYIINGLEYVDPGIIPRVDVAIEKMPHGYRIRIQDNGRGMDRNGLAHFFTLHGENLDRKSGRTARGRFGTGKSAAFVIADTLEVITVRHGLRNHVALNRNDIRAMADGSPVPVRIHEQDAPTSQKNGTTIIISDLRIEPNRRAILEFIKRNMATMPGSVVSLDGTEVRFKEPPCAGSFVFEPTAPGLIEKIGTAQLTRAGREVHLKAGQKMVIEAGVELTLKAGGTFIKLNPGGITVSGPLARINAGGAPGKGSGIKIKSPVRPGMADGDKAGSLLEQALQGEADSLLRKRKRSLNFSG